MTLSVILTRAPHPVDNFCFLISARSMLYFANSDFLFTFCLFCSFNIQHCFPVASKLHYRLSYCMTLTIFFPFKYTVYWYTGYWSILDLNSHIKFTHALNAAASFASRGDEDVACFYLKVLRGRKARTPCGRRAFPPLAARITSSLENPVSSGAETARRRAAIRATLAEERVRGDDKWRGHASRN